jgi:methionyl-tRNA formyltransferase
MKFAITAIDRYCGVLEAFLAAGWEPVKLFTVEARSELDSQRAVIALAAQHGAAIQISRMTAPDLADLAARGCEALIVASYDWPIGDWTPYLKYAVNFHASPLPEGRGPYPAPRAILERRDAWGVACHRLTTEIDRGEILDAEAFALRPDECHESLDLKIQMAAARLASRLAGDFAGAWARARPQGEGSYWRKCALRERVLDFRAPVDDVVRHVRAFGATGSLAAIGATWFAVRRAVGWAERHDLAPGAVAHVHNRSIVIATPDGYVALLETEPAPRAAVVELQAQLRPPGAPPQRAASQPAIARAASEATSAENPLPAQRAAAASRRAASAAP